MKSLSNLVLISTITLAIQAPLMAQEKLERGKDRVDTPAIGAGLCVHNLFQSNMVIQRDRPIGIWGWAAPGEKVTVTFGENTQSATAGADRSWKVELPAMPVSSEPRTMSVQVKDTKIELTNILLGDVWLLSGQSNMEFPISKVEEGDLEIISANLKNIRLMTIPQQNGPEVLRSFPRLYQWNDFFGTHYRQGFWDVCTPETANEMSAIGLVFARRIHLATQIPIGIVDLSRGGTCLATWTPTEVLKTIDTPEVKGILAEWDKNVADFNPQKDLQNRIKQHEDRVAKMKAEGKPIPADSKPPTNLLPGPAVDMNRPGNLFASTVCVIAGFPVKGAIWHQGYNDAFAPTGYKLYGQVFPEMIKAWRSAFNDPAMPFGIITQETEGEPQSLEQFLPAMVNLGIYIREVHYQTFLNLRQAGDKTIGYASCFDQHRSWYHPQIKVPVGERIARWALATQYGKTIRWLPPQLKEVKPEADKLILSLDTPVVAYNDGPILGFAIAGKDGRFQPAKAQYFNKNLGPGAPSWDQTKIVLTSPMIPEPIYFRYAWARNPLENLKSGGLPFDTQRNDTFSLGEMYENYSGKKSATPGILQGGEFGVLMGALREGDLSRRKEEAKALLEAK